MGRQQGNAMFGMNLERDGRFLYPAVLGFPAGVIAAMLVISLVPSKPMAVMEFGDRIALRSAPLEIRREEAA